MRMNEIQEESSNQFDFITFLFKKYKIVSANNIHNQIFKDMKEELRYNELI